MKYKIYLVYSSIQSTQLKYKYLKIVLKYQTWLLCGKQLLNITSDNREPMIQSFCRNTYLLGKYSIKNCFNFRPETISQSII